MKLKLLTTLLFLSSQVSFSQNIKGKVVFNNYAIPKVEVINATTKIHTVTDENGNFSITAKTNEILVFVSKQHQLKKLTLNPALFTNSELIVELLLKAEELKEVVITNMPSIKLSSDANYEQGKLDDYTLVQAATRPKIVGLNKGKIENGPDFMRIAGMLVGLFIKEKEPAKKEAPEVSFKDFVKSSCDQNYFEKTLNLKPDEINLFLEFCDADPKSKIIAETNNVLSVMDFLFTKNSEFKKL